MHQFGQIPSPAAIAKAKTSVSLVHSKPKVASTATKSACPNFVCEFAWCLTVGKHDDRVWAKDIPERSHKVWLNNIVPEPVQNEAAFMTYINQTMVQSCLVGWCAVHGIKIQSSCDYLHCRAQGVGFRQPKCGSKFSCCPFSN